MTDLQTCQRLDEQDPLAPLRQQFALNEGEIYLDGNSLGVLPRATSDRVRQVVEKEWGRDLIRSWNTAGWITLPQRLGDMIAKLIGAAPGEVVVADSTSVNLYKVLAAAAALVRADAPGRTRIISERSNFPTDLYIAEGVARQYGLTLELIDADTLDLSAIEARLGDDVAILLLTHVNYRTGRMHDMAAVTGAAHQAGVRVIWDLAHSTGAVPVDLTAADADYAIGCSYKYLNGGPGAPAFVWVNPRLADRFWQPLSGWMGHASPFEFTPDYSPAPGIGRYLCGTPAVLSMSALQCGLDIFEQAEPFGGLAALRRKSVALTSLFIELMHEPAQRHALVLASPRQPENRGSQVSYAVADGAYAIIQALIARGVVGDFRAPDIMRFGFTPLYTRFVDVWHAVSNVTKVLDRGEWREARFHQRATVT